MERKDRRAISKSRRAVLIANILTLSFALLLFGAIFSSDGFFENPDRAYSVSQLPAGEGTKTSPYQIKNSATLRWLLSDSEPSDAVTYANILSRIDCAELEESLFPFVKGSLNLSGSTGAALLNLPCVAGGIFGANVLTNLQSVEFTFRSQTAPIEVADAEFGFLSPRIKGNITDCKFTIPKNQINATLSAQNGYYGVVGVFEGKVTSCTVNMTDLSVNFDTKSQAESLCFSYGGFAGFLQGDIEKLNVNGRNTISADFSGRYENPVTFYLGGAIGEAKAKATVDQGGSVYFQFVESTLDLDLAISANAAAKIEVNAAGAFGAITRVYNVFFHIKYCSYTGTLRQKKSETQLPTTGLTANIGGIVGLISDSISASDIFGCTFGGKQLICEGFNAAKLDQINFGGIAGYFGGSGGTEGISDINRSISDGALEFRNDGIGCASTTAISIGGLVGRSRGAKFQSLRNGSRLSVASVPSDAVIAVGGLVGYVEFGTSTNYTKLFENSENVGALQSEGIGGAAGAIVSGGLAGIHFVTDLTENYVHASNCASHGVGFTGGLFGKILTSGAAFPFKAEYCLISFDPDPSCVTVGPGGMDGAHAYTSCFWYSETKTACNKPGFSNLSFDTVFKYGNYFKVERNFFNKSKPNEATLPTPIFITLDYFESEFKKSEPLKTHFSNMENRRSLKLFEGGSGTQLDPFLVSNSDQFGHMYKVAEQFPNSPSSRSYVVLTDDITIDSSYDVALNCLSKVLFNGRGHTVTVPQYRSSFGYLFPKATDSDITNCKFVSDGQLYGSFSLVGEVSKVTFQSLIIDFAQATNANPALYRTLTEGSTASASIIAVLSHGTAFDTAPLAYPAGQITTAKNVFLRTAALPSAVTKGGGNYIYCKDPASFLSKDTMECEELIYNISAEFYYSNGQYNIRIGFDPEQLRIADGNQFTILDENGKEVKRTETDWILNSSYYGGDIFPKILRDITFHFLYVESSDVRTESLYYGQATDDLSSPRKGNWVYYYGAFTAETGGVEITAGKPLALGAGAIVLQNDVPIQFHNVVNGGVAKKTADIYYRYKTITKFEDKEYDGITIDSWSDTEGGREFTATLSDPLLNAGTYRYNLDIYEKGRENDGVILGNLNTLVTIRRTNVNVTPTPGDNLKKVYDGTSDVDIAYTYDRHDLVNSDEITGKLIIYAVHVGTWSISVGQLSVGRNFDITLKQAEFVIVPKPISDFVWTMPEASVYDKTIKPIAVVPGEGALCGKDKTELSFSTVKNGQNVEFRDAGDYEFTLTGSSNADYVVDVGAASAKATYTIQKATASANVAAYTTLVYDAERHFPSIKVGNSDTPFDEPEIRVEFNDSSGKVFSGALNAGVYDNISIKFTPFTGNFNEIETAIARITIEKRPVEVRFPGIEDLKYTGREAELYAEIVGMLSNEKITAKIKYDKNGVAVAKPTDPGTYTATIATNALLLNGAVPVNYCLTAPVVTSFTIGKADMRDPQINVGALTYMDDTIANLKVEARFRDVNGKYISSVQMQVLTVVDKIEAGTIPVVIRWTPAGDIAENYNPYETTVNVVVNRKKVTITAVAATGQYGDPLPAFAFTGGEEVVMVGDRFEGALSLDRSDVAPIGTYPIRIGDLTAGKNYEISFVSAPYVVTPRRVTAGFGVIPRLVYDGQVKNVDCELYNVVADDEVNARLVYYRSGETEPCEPKNAGSYRVLAEALDNPNYTFGAAIPSAQFSINRAEIEGISFSDDEIEYDGLGHTLQVAGLPDFVEAVYSKTEIRDAGVYPITVNFTLSENYVPIEPLTATLTISQAAVSAFDFSAFEAIVYRGEPIELRVFASDAKAEDLVEAIYETDRTTLEVGEYTGRITGVKDNNYKLTNPVSFSFSVEKRPVYLRLNRAVGKSYDGTTEIALSMLDFAVEGLLDGATITGDATFRLADPGESGGSVALLIEGLRLTGEKSESFTLVTDGNFVDVRLTEAKDANGNRVSSPSFDLDAGARLTIEAGKPEDFEKAVKGIDGTFRVSGVYKIALKDSDGNDVALPSDAVAVVGLANAGSLKYVYVVTDKGLKQAEFTVDGDTVTVNGATGTLIFVERPQFYDALTLLGIVLGAIAVVLIALIVVRGAVKSKKRRK